MIESVAAWKKLGEGTSVTTCVVAPRLPPNIDGVGDYCKRLWENLSSNSGQGSGSYGGHLPWRFLVFDGGSRSNAYWTEVRIDQCSPNSDSLLSALENCEASLVILQYSGYGFDTSGAPKWLVHALRNWLAGDTHRKLVVMFHELWATGYPWQRAFWQSIPQKQCVTELLELASCSIVSLGIHFQRLMDLNGQKPIQLIPIGSNFIVDAPQSLHWRRISILGQPNSRKRAIKIHADLISLLVRSGLVDELILAGRSTSPQADESKQLLQSFARCKITEIYNFPPEQVPPYVLGCGLALMHVKASWLLKSGSFHLSAAAGQVAIAKLDQPPEPPLVSPHNCLCYGEPSELLPMLDPEVLATISQRIAALSVTTFSWQSIAHRWAEALAPL